MQDRMFPKDWNLLKVKSKKWITRLVSHICPYVSCVDYILSFIVAAKQKEQGALGDEIASIQQKMQGIPPNISLIVTC